MNKLRYIVVGIIMGAMLTAGMSYAADKMNIQVNFLKVSFWIDGQPYTQKTTEVMNYRGTNYVPIRFVSEALGKQVQWDPTQRRIMVDSMNLLQTTEVDVSKESLEIQQWVQDSKVRFMGQVKKVGNTTYLLATRGEQSTGGYDIVITGVKEIAGRVKVGVKLVNPAKGSLVTDALTYPYALVKLNQSVDAPVDFISNDGTSLPKLVGMDAMKPVLRTSQNIVLFKPTITNDALHLEGVARAFEGVIAFKLINSKGEEVVNEPLLAAGGAPNWGHFSTSLYLSSLQPGMRIRLLLFSMNDGSVSEMIDEPISPMLP